MTTLQTRVTVARVSGDRGGFDRYLSCIFSYTSVRDDNDDDTAA